MIIGIQDLAANALIELLDADEKRRQVRIEELSQYGTVVLQVLKEKREDVVLLLLREHTDDMIRNYSDIFMINDDYTVISLREGVDADMLRRKFRAYLSVDTLLAFSCERARRVLNIG